MKHETPFLALGHLRAPEDVGHFYKYKYIDDSDDEHLDHSRCIFTNNELYFSKVSAFNDPFDCKFQVEFSGAKHDKSKFLEDLSKKNAPHLNRQQRRSKAREETKVLDDPDLASAVRGSLIQEIEKWGIYCLSEIPDNILMWSHYANAHRGFCLEFASRESDALFGVELWLGGQKQKREIVAPFPVEYSTKYPVANLLNGQIAKDTFLRKAKQWEYEKEWRMMVPNGPGARQFPPQCLTGVIFGCRMTEKHKEMIREWCRNREPAITYYEARESEDSYSLNIVEISRRPSELGK